MDAALLVARLLLVVVFGVAGLAKLADRAGSRQALVDFGVPPPLASPLGHLLPLAELAVAVALLPAASAWWGALGALLLLLLFVVAIGVNLARGRRPDCRCFGQVHSSPVGPSTLTRNGVLAAVSGFVVWQGQDGAGPSAVGWLGSLTAMQYAVLVAAVIGLGLVVAVVWCLVQLMAQNGRLLLRIEALEAQLGGGPAAGAAGSALGTPGPRFALPDLAGQTVTLDALLAGGKPVLLLFTDPNCGPCNHMLPEIGRWQRKHADKFSIALITRGSPEANRAKTAEHGLHGVLLQRDWEVSEAYHVTGTPSAVLVRPDGAIGSAVALGEDAIQALVDRALVAPPLGPMPGRALPTATVVANGAATNGAVHLPAEPEVSMLGEPAPAVSLPDLNGKPVDLVDFRGSETLLLFWNPDCGFCRQMLPDLKAWERKAPAGAPKLLVVSRGTSAANKAMGLRSPVVLDQDFAVGKALGAPGTPSAVLVDAQGKIASQIVVGAADVLELAASGAAQQEQGSPAAV